jgi:hypothetical protein
MTSYPMLCRRDLGNNVRHDAAPGEAVVPHRHPARKIKDNETRQWLQAFEETQRRAMYDPAAKFTRATKEGDHDFAAFGQCAISVELNKQANGSSTAAGTCATWRGRRTRRATSARASASGSRPRRLCRTFGKDKLHADIVKGARRSRSTEFNVMHIVVEADMYDEKTQGRGGRSGTTWTTTAN